MMAILYILQNGEGREPRIIFIILHHVHRHTLKHVTCEMGRHLLGKVRSVNLYQFIMSDVSELAGSTLNTTTLGILQLLGSRGI
jgi:hypothetical protein